MKIFSPTNQSRPVLVGFLALSTMMSPMVSPRAAAAGFGDDVAFLKKYTAVVVLRDPTGAAQVAIAPAWQGRVMTSTAGGEGGPSFGWINRELIAAGKLQPHLNVFGGEDRFWLGPEGGQFSIFFAPGAKFELNDWFTPAPLDTLPYRLLQQSDSLARFGATFSLTNYRGTAFEVQVSREVRLLSATQAWEKLGVKSFPGVRLVAYESANEITNVGPQAWQKETGLLSIWILGMFNPTARTTIVVPIKPGLETELGVPVTSDYFGRVPPERLVVQPSALFFKGDGQFRSKIGVSPRRSTGVLGSYDAASQVLTIVQFTKPAGVTDYVNSLWKLQDNPYSGYAANSYNDGPSAPGVKPLGPFYELESSSPAAALAPGQSLTHVHRTLHLSGAEKDLDVVARAAFGVSLAEMKAALKP